MNVDVYLRRCRGQRLSSADENAQTPLFGELSLAYVSSAHMVYAVLSLQAFGNQTKEGTLLHLYEPVITGVGDQWLVFRGFESFAGDGGTVSFLQEWRCKLRRSGG